MSTAWQLPPVRGLQVCHISSFSRCGDFHHAYRFGAIALISPLVTAASTPLGFDSFRLAIFFNWPAATWVALLVRLSLCSSLRLLMVADAKHIAGQISKHIRQLVRPALR